MNDLSQVPGLAGYIAAQQQGQQQTMGNLNVANMLEQLQQRQAANQKEQAYREEISAATTPEQQEAVAVKYGGPDAVMKATAAKAQREQAASQYVMTLQQRQDALDERKRQFDQTTTDKQARDAFDQQYKLESMRNKQQMDGLLAQFKMMGLELQKEKINQGQNTILQKQTQALGGALQKANLPEADATLNAVEQMLKTKPELAEWISGPKSMVPDALAPQEVRDARQAFSKLFNVTLKLRSGAAVTQQELDRLKNEFGVGVTKNPAQVGTAVEQARNIITKHYRAVASGFGNDALEAYNSNVEQLGGTPILKQNTPQQDPLGIRR